MDDRETLSNLKFICKIGKGDKINIGMMCVQPTSIFTTISRTILNQDNRKNTLSFVTQTINKAFGILKNLKDRSSKPQELESNKVCDETRIACTSRPRTTSLTYSSLMVDNIVNDLVDSKSGLENLKYTYSQDVKFCCDIDTLLQIINARLRDCGIEQEQYQEYIDISHVENLG
jgi:hypothetical protein